MSENEIIEWLNKNFVGLIKILPIYNMYYIDVLYWNVIDKKLKFYYKSYWEGKKYIKMKNIDNLLLIDFDYIVKIGEKKGKKNPEIDPFEEEFWGAEN
jgi:hypothetical protein